jgi:hypothetical protein
MNVIVADFMWLAGWLEGEGCFQLVQVRKKDRPTNRLYTQIKITARSVDLDTLERVQRIVGGVINGPYEYVGNQPLWHWSFNSRAEALNLMRRLHPHMSQRRRVKIADILNQALSEDLEVA